MKSSFIVNTFNAKLADRAKDSAAVKNGAASIMLAFSNVRKIQSPDLDIKVAKLSSDIERLLEGVYVDYFQGKLVVRVNGSSEHLLSELRRGSSWFEAVPDIDHLILAALINKQSL